jgi:hypothetical protein
MSKTFRQTKKGEVIQDKDRRNMKASRSCLNHGGCPHCLKNHLHSIKRAEPIKDSE